jgi:hypothetical protein
MARPRYETQSDRDNELRAIPMIESALHGVARKLPDNHFADFVVIDATAQVVAYVEFKCRSFRWGDYPTVMLSVSKFAKLVAARDVRVRSFFVVQDSFGEVKAVDLHRSDLDYRVEYGGRTAKTRDRRDVEPVVHIQTEQFRTIGHVERREVGSGEEDS